MRGASGFNIDVEPLRQLMLTDSKGFPDDPFEPIALNGIAKALCGSNAKPGVTIFAFPGLNDHPIPDMFCRLLGDTLELAARAEARRLWKAIAHALDSSGELFTTLTTAAINDLAAIRSLHSSTESMNGFAATLAWLICTFHDVILRV